MEPSKDDMIVLAAGELTGKMLFMDTPARKLVGIYEIDEFITGYHELLTRLEYRDIARELEAKHGYIPWLHNRVNEGGGYDLRWRFEQGLVPKVKAGTLPPDESWYELKQPKPRMPGRWD